MRARFYLLAALFAAAVPATAQAEHLLGLHYGRHSYSSRFEQSILGAEYAYKFPSALSLGAGGDYISNDFGGDDGARVWRFSAGPNVHFRFGCIPIDVVPGVGLEYLRIGGAEFDRCEAFGAYVRLQVLVRILDELSAGMYTRKTWNAVDSLGQEVVGAVQFAFGLPSPPPRRTPPPAPEPGGQYIRYDY